jgi:hypothetical protein
MTIRKNRSETRESEIVGEIEKGPAVVADGFGDRASCEPLPVRLSDVWSDFLRLAGDSDPAGPTPRRGSGVPILDDMKGILQWD